MSRVLRRAPKLRDVLATNNASDRYYAAMSGKPPMAQTVIAPKRAYTKPNPSDTEAPVLAAITELLHFHPDILFALRTNSGAAFTENNVPIHFYRIIRRPYDFTLTDFWGLLKSGQHGPRLFALEAKRPSWKEPRTERELKQQAFIRIIVEAGGVGGFVRSVEEAQTCLSQ